MQRVRLLPAAVLAAGATAWCVLQGVPMFRADVLSAQARDNVEAWALAGKGWTVDDWQATRTRLLAALELTPDDPVQHITLAQLYATQGLVAWADLPQREAFFEEALMHQQQALQLRPKDGRTWAQAAVSMFALRRPIAELQQAWMQARRHAPRELPVQRTLCDLAVATWDTATPEMRAWVLATYKNAEPALQNQLRKDAARHGRSVIFEAL